MTKATYADIFHTIALAFTDCDQSEWDEATNVGSWSAFLSGVREKLSTGTSKLTIGDCLSHLEANALHNPPTFEEKVSFAARSFTGGLPSSAMPVESLYRDSNVPEMIDNTMRTSRSHEQEYWGLSALYMKDLVDALGLTLPDTLAAYPDHLGVEAEVAACMFDTDAAIASSFIAERFSWLPTYRARLISLDDADARFYCALLGIVLCLVQAQDTDEVWESSTHEADQQAHSSNPMNREE